MYQVSESLLQAAVKDYRERINIEAFQDAHTSIHSVLSREGKFNIASLFYTIGFIASGAYNNRTKFKKDLTVLEKFALKYAIEGVERLQKVLEPYKDQLEDI